MVHSIEWREIGFRSVSRAVYVDCMSRLREWSKLGSKSTLAFSRGECRAPLL